MSNVDISCYVLLISCNLVHNSTYHLCVHLDLHTLVWASLYDDGITIALTNDKYDRYLLISKSCT